MRSRFGFYSGLATTTLVTLAIELINTRIFSVINWYHLSFVAISIAMLGMTAGAVYVYIRPDNFSEERVPAQLCKYSLLFAISIPVCHILNISFRPGNRIWSDDPYELVQLLMLMSTAAIPFFYSGVVVALSLTRVALPIGRIYFFDLLGASAGCLGVILLLQHMDPSSALFLLGGLAGLAALAYSFDARQRRSRPVTILTVIVSTVFILMSILNGESYPKGIRLTHSKGSDVPKNVVVDRWNTHSRILAYPIVQGTPMYWGIGKYAPKRPSRWAFLNIDGDAATTVNEFHPDNVAGIQWIKHDVTSLAYHLIRGGDVAVIGVGGGRDILTALAFGCHHVTGVELNQIFLDLLGDRYRYFSEISTHPDVTLIHDDGRSYLARSREKFDLIQMSLIDTWASTSAGGMTLSENGLYTVEAWQTFLGRLKPGGVLTVSRWFTPEDLGETARLISLATASLLEEGAERPEDHIVLASADRISTIIVSSTPFSRDALQTIRNAVAHYGFGLLLFPGEPAPDPRLTNILEARSTEELSRNVRDPILDLGPPHDDKPFFFNMVKPQSWWSARNLPLLESGVITGNLVATENLMTILFAVTFLVLLSIIMPLLLFGRRHGLSPGQFTMSAHYFASIGLGFMLIEIGLIQRFSVLLGHPIWALVVILFSMILFTGIGSLLSDRIPLSGTGIRLFVPIGIFVVILIVTYAIQPAIDATISADFFHRALMTLSFCVPVGLCLGVCFPLGMRLVQEHSKAAMPWMWGINGAFGVLGGVVAMIISMAWGISWSIAIGGMCYLSLALPVSILQRCREGSS